MLAHPGCSIEYVPSSATTRAREFLFLGLQNAPAGKLVADENRGGDPAAFLLSLRPRRADEGVIEDVGDGAP
ncbi:hypothetical protein [Streptomonospora alba]|nr:hypothetical protein [Streptomonospora alba]